MYAIEISSVAEAEADQAFLWMSQVTTPEKARYWYKKCLMQLNLYQKCRSVVL